jgi:hypothetical protein
MPRARVTPEPPIYTFRVRIRGGFFAPSDAESVWRELEVAANQTLADLGNAIPEAFGFTDPHLWSFFLSGKPWDGTSEYARQGRTDPLSGARVPSAAGVRIDQVPFPGRDGTQEFLFLFDYGDEWHFGVQLLGTSPTVLPGVRYPRVVASAGQAPRQYPDAEELDDDWLDEDEEEAEDDERDRF